ncbi:MAG TPA: macro domain-containing protein [Chloroflexota bacterium]
MEQSINGHMLELIQGDITEMEVDAIVNAANENLVPGAGVAGAIDRVGGPSIREKAFALPGSPRCPTGSAVATAAGRLRARHVIHAVAPIWQGGSRGEPELLRGAYRRSLELADQLGDRTIAFPSLGTGVFGYPIREAAQIALSTVAEYLRGATQLERVTFVLFSAADLETYGRVLQGLDGDQPDGEGGGG